MLYNAAAVVAISTVLAVGAFLGFLAGSGRLDAQRIDLIAKVLRGELTGDPNEHAQDAHSASQPAASQPSEAAGHGHDSAHELQAKRERDQLHRTMAERSMRDLIAQRELLEQALGHLVREEEQFESQKKQWELTRQKLQQQDRDAGFEEELKLVSKLSPQQSKEHLVLTWKKSPADAVRLIKALNPSRSQRILEQLKSAEELQILHELLEQLRKMDVDTLVPESGKASGDTGH
jgi:hypothetical protein